ncbi:MFS transporter [Halalkalicoccus jeotgali]|uniref:Oxalate/formate antiporter n=1 Tax=Halalkalicoccus jeotgali (strain DSM 18796 / CECT 7217 / JCM 14584 / KCTC 4019 / B3) TaxID=795797 RepID=D8JCK3_HALJB|nr:MFS transporter [Halalkalicoccus jeotgali]ADJ17110.1 oxalate/formate antiporter [Halalkalicoccus jeotgali B3]ELY41735.1 oxalate/formate antiporter [Halalkalicoccus jeotgali B3]
MMALVSPYQYVWSSIEGPLATDLSIPLPALGLVFTLFVAFQSLSQFPVGWWRDTHGPRRISLLGGVLAGGGYLGLAYATAIWQIYMLYSLGAVGVGIVYTVAINSALKWFPDHRGLTTGIGTMAFAAGSAVFIPYVRANATPGAYSGVLRNIGVLIGVGVICGAVVLRDPPAGWSQETSTTAATPENPTTTEKEGFTWREMVRTWQFWTLLGMFAFVNTAGLMLTAKVVSFAQQFGLTAIVGTVSATVLALVGGISRIVVGGVSDWVDRKWAIAISSILTGVGLFLLVWFGQIGSSLGFILAVIIATFFWSPQFALFPSIVGDYYGQAHSSTNYALVYLGKVGGGVAGGVLAGVLITMTSWSMTFLVGGILAVVAGFGALLLRPP